MITVIHRRQTATHARLTWQDYGLRIEWGSTKRRNFSPVSIEVLPFNEYPELRELHDGIGWNLDELRRLLDNAEGTALPEAVLVLFMQKDIDLLAEVGLALQ